MHRVRRVTGAFAKVTFSCVQSTAAPALKAPPTSTKSTRKDGDGTSLEVIWRAGPSKEAIRLVGKKGLNPNMINGTNKLNSGGRQ